MLIQCGLLTTHHILTLNIFLSFVRWWRTPATPISSPFTFLIANSAGVVREGVYAGRGNAAANSFQNGVNLKASRQPLSRIWHLVEAIRHRGELSQKCGGDTVDVRRTNLCTTSQKSQHHCQQDQIWGEETAWQGVRLRRAPNSKPMAGKVRPVLIGRDIEIPKADYYPIYGAERRPIADWRARSGEDCVVVGSNSASNEWELRQ